MQSPSGQGVLFVDVAPFTGGAQRSLVSLVKGLSARSWQTHVLSADHTDAGVIVSCEAQGVPVRPLSTSHWRKSVAGFMRFALERTRSVRSIRRAIADWQPAVIHANTVRAALVIPREAWLTHPVCVHDRDLRVPRLAVGYVRHRAARVIAISRCVAEKWRMPAACERLTVVPNGLDLAQLERESRSLPDDDVPASPMALLVADMVPWKRHILFLEAVAAARKTVPELTAVIVGRTRTREGEKYLASLRHRVSAAGLSGHVRFVTDAASAMPWLAIADVLVSAAAEEPFGRTVVEALAVGTPVVALKGGGPEDILRGCPAGTVTDGTAAQLAQGICAWVRSGDRGLIETAAKSRAAEFSLDAMASAISTIYENLV